MKKSKKYLLINIVITSALSILFSIIIFFILYHNDNEKNYYQENISKVVEVCAYTEEEEKSYGTAWFIDDEILVTNFHVVSYLHSGEHITFDNVLIRFYDEDEYTVVQLYKSNEENDIAFLKYQGTHTHSKFVETTEISTGDSCYTIGNFSNYGLSYKEGKISLKSVNLSYNNTISLFIQCLLPIGQGDSGAPLFNSSNKVIGMITFRTKNNGGVVEQCYAYAIPVERILYFYQLANNS